MFRIVPRYVDVLNLNKPLPHVSNLKTKRRIKLTFFFYEQKRKDSILPSALNPGVDVNCSTSIIFTAYCFCPLILTQRRTTLNGPLDVRKNFN